MAPLFPNDPSDDAGRQFDADRDAIESSMEARVALLRLRAVFESMSEGLVVHAPDGRIVDANRAAERVLGLSRDQLLGKTSWDPAWRAIREDGTPMHGDEHPAVLTFRSGVAQRGFIMGIRITGVADRWISINTQPIADAGDMLPSGVVATFVDVTEQRQSLTDLQRVRADLAAVLEAIPARVTAWNADYTNRFANQRAEREWRLPPNGATGLPVWEILGSERFARARPYIEGALAGAVQSHQQIDPQADGSTQYSMVTYVPMLRDEQVIGVYALGFNITPLREAQEALRATVDELEQSVAAAQESELRLRTIANGVPMTIGLFDAEERIIFANLEFGKLGNPQHGVEGRQAHEFFSPDLYDQGRSARSRALNGEMVQFEVTFKIGDELRLREVTFSPYRDLDGRIVGVYALGYDVTEINRSRERVRALAQRLAHDREVEKVALSTTLHEHVAQELFAARLSLKQLARIPAGSNDWQSAVDEIAQSLENTVGELRRLTNDLVPISLANLPLATTLRLYAEDFGVRFALTVHFDLSERALDLAPALRLLMFRALQQALDNTRQHAMAQSVRIGLSADSATITLTVADDGIGIADAAAEKASSHGVLFLSERFKSAGGAFSVQRAANGGTVVAASLPILSSSAGSPESAGTLP